MLAIEMTKCEQTVRALTSRCGSFWVGEEDHPGLAPVHERFQGRFYTLMCLEFPSKPVKGDGVTDLQNMGL